MNDVPSVLEFLCRALFPTSRTRMPATPRPEATSFLAAIVQTMHDFTYNLTPLIASISHLGFILISCQIFRFVKKTFIGDPLVRITVEEFICTLQLCVTNFELGIVTEVYGLSGYAVGLFVTSITYSLTFEHGTADPSECLDHYCKRQMSGREFIPRVVSSLLGAAVAYKAAKVFWSLGMCVEHVVAYTGSGQCTASLQVPAILGLMFEATETFLNRIVQNTSGFNMVNGGMSDVAITFFGLLVTGGYFNPSLALAMEFGCSGLSYSDFALIYWIGPAVGTLVALQTAPRIIRVLDGEPSEPERLHTD